jgi:hypothetical protein
MRRNGLSKYDAPLKIQFEWGYEAFKKGKCSKAKKGFFAADSGMDRNTMQHREWVRGWNTAFYDNLERITQNEKARAGS